MKTKLLYMSEMCKAAGRIVAGLAMLNFKISFWSLRITLFTGLAFAMFRLTLHFRVAMLTGLVLILIGGIFIVWTHRIVTRFPIKMKKLVISGPFSVARHPMYSGWSLVAIGSAMIAGHWLVTILAILQILFMFSVSCAEDEENAEVFGAEYIRYSANVWLMGIFIGRSRLLVRKIKKR